MWGFDLPYMLTGLLNQHPRAAIKFKAADAKGDLVKFYDSVSEEL
jgi:4-hydroxy 2-oxovalerate aldolase